MTDIDQEFLCIVIGSGLFCLISGLRGVCYKDKFSPANYHISVIQLIWAIMMMLMLLFIYCFTIDLRWKGSIPKDVASLLEIIWFGISMLFSGIYGFKKRKIINNPIALQISMSQIYGFVMVVLGVGLYIFLWGWPK